MIAIETRYHGPTNHKPSRYSASTANGQRIMVSQDSDLTSDENHAYVANRLALEMDWLTRDNRLVGGHTKSGMCFVFVKN